MNRRLNRKKFKKGQKIARLEDDKWIGLWFFNAQNAIAKRDSLSVKYDRKIEVAHSERKKQKLRNKRAKKYDKKNRKVKQGNQLMRWGEPLSIYNHSASVLTSQKIKQYLASEGYFDATVQIDTSHFDSLSVIAKMARSTRNWVSGWSGHSNRYIDLNYNVELKHTLCD